MAVDILWGYVIRKGLQCYVQVTAENAGNYYSNTFFEKGFTEFNSVVF